jgi:hypothetical protein
MSAIGELLTASKQWKASHPKHKETKPRHKRSMGMPPVYELQPGPICATLIRNPIFGRQQKYKKLCVWKSERVLMGIRVHQEEDDDKVMKNGKELPQSKSTAAIEPYSTMTLETFDRR